MDYRFLKVCEYTIGFCGLLIGSTLMDFGLVSALLVLGLVKILWEGFISNLPTS